MRSLTRSLVGRLVLSFLLPSFFIVFLVDLLAYLRAKAALRESIFERLEAIATVKESALDDWILHHRHDVVVLSKVPEIGELIATLVDEGEAAERRREAYRSLDGVFSTVAEEKPGIAEIFVLSAAGGKIVLSTEKSNEGQYRIYDRYYEEGKKAPFIQNVYPSPFTLRPTLTISAPIRGPAGDVVAVLAAHLSLTYLDEKILQRTGLGRSGVVTLVDRHEVFVTGQSYREQAELSPAVEEVLRGSNGAGLYRVPAGARVIGVYHWLEERELGLIVEMGQQEAFAPAHRLAVSILLAGIFFVALLLGLIYAAARRTARPLLEMTETALKVSGGDLDSRAPVRTRDEIGTLATTFNQMIVQLRTLYDEMARKISQLEVAEKEQEALIAELETKNAELERFSYTVSHDLKGPLWTIKGFLGFLRQGLDRGNVEQAKADLEKISSAADRMGRLLDELLELSRIGRIAHPPEAVPFAELAREAVAAVVPGDGVRIDVGDDLPIVYGDRVRLLEVVENLVVNAVKFMGDQAAPRVEIGARRDDGETVFYVGDNGTGIDPRYHEKVFGLFERLNPDVDGTGIGLAIVRRIVGVHGGRIWIESAGEGRGSTFCFTLPVAGPDHSQERQKP